MKRTPLYRPRPGSIQTLGVPSLRGVRSVHLIGVGGAGMRNLARLFLARGVEVSGSDLKDSEGLRELARAGARVRVGHDAGALGDPDAVVISSAIGDDNTELAAARARARRVGATTGDRRVRGRSPVDRRGRHHREDDDDVDDRDGARGRGPRPDVSDRWRPERERERGQGGRWRPLPVRGRRERRFLPPHRPRDRRRDQRRGRSRRLLSGGRGRLRSAFAEFCARSERVVGCVDDAGAREALRLAGVDAIGYGVGPDADVRLAVGSPGPGVPTEP